jgi:hypothetical protein
MVHRLARGTDAATGQTGDDGLEGQLVADHHIQRHLVGVQHALELLGLRQGPRESVEDEAEPCRTAQAVVPLAQQRQHDGVGHQLAPLHVLDRAGHRRTADDGESAMSDDLAHRQGAGAKLLPQQLGLCPLAHPGGPQQNDPPFPAGGGTHPLAAGLASLDPSRAIRCHGGTHFKRRARRIRAAAPP